MSTIRLPAKLENLERLMESVSGFAKSQGFSQRRLQEIELAAEEALVNIFNYAYPDQGPGDVEIRCRTGDHNTLIIEFLDNGIPFNIETLSEPDLNAPISQRKVGGLGVFLMRKMVDDVHYRREGDQNILTFILHENKGG